MGTSSWFGRLLSPWGWAWLEEGQSGAVYRMGPRAETALASVDWASCCPEKIRFLLRQGVDGQLSRQPSMSAPGQGQ